MLGIAGVQAQTIVPSQTDEIIIDNATSGKADPGDRIRYKVTIQNTGGPDGAGTQLNIVPDPRTTFVPGTFRSSPLAVPDAFACTGNVGINVPAASGVKINDFDDNLAGTTLSCGTCTSANGGTVTLNNDGSFTYNPPAGFTGTDNFTYTITDGNPVGAPVPVSDNATVTITVSNMIWFVSNVLGGSGGTGTRVDPFRTLADFNGSSGPLAGHVVHIQYTGTNYPGGLVLKDNMRVIGTGHTGGATLADVLPFAVAPNSFILPAIDGSRPVITNAGGDGVALAQNNNLRGFDVGNCSDFGMDNIGTNSIGNFVLSEVNISNGTGGGFDASHGSGAGTNAVFDAISSSGGVNGIDLTNCAGTFTVNGGTITNPSGTGALISGGSVAVTCAAAISDNTGFAVDIDNHDSGNATFSGNITSTGTGIRVQNCGGGTKTFSGASKSLNTGTNAGVTLSSNTGATISFTTGGLVISTTSGTGFNATGGATAVNVTGTGNTIASTTGTALNVANTTIGASGLTFQSISANGGTAAGIILNNTGTSGGLTVTGDGANMTKGGNGTGGTIANKDDGGVDDSGSVGTAIFLNNTSNVVLRRMQINDCKNFGIRGLDVGNFTFQYSTINGLNGDNTVGTEDCIGFGTSQPAGANGLKNGAVVLVDNCIIRGAVEHNVEFYNIANTFTATISNSNITNNTIASGSDGIQIELHTDSNAGTPPASGTFSIQNCFFDDNKSQAVQAAANGDSFIDITINGCTVQKTTQGNEGFVLSNGTDGDLTAHVTNNMITNILGANIFVGQTAGNATSNSNLNAVISGNVMTTGAVGGPYPTNRTLLVFLSTNVNGAASNANVLIDGNTINTVSDPVNGLAQPLFVSTPDGNTNPAFSATVINNTVNIIDPSGTSSNGIAVQATQGTSAILHADGCFDVRNNDVNYTPSAPMGINGIRVRQNGFATVQLEQGISAGAASTVLAANNPATTTEILGTVNVVSNSTCLPPPN